MAVFPMFIEMGNTTCLIIGGGHVALRKAEVLCQMGAKVHVLSKKFDERFSDMEASGRLECHLAEGGPLTAAAWLEQSVDKDDHVLLICATDDPTVNHQLALLGKKYRVPVNSATSPEDCTFYFPSVVRRGDLTVGISTGGKAPSLSRIVSGQIESEMPEWYDRLLETGHLARKKLKEISINPADRRELMERILQTAMKSEGKMEEKDMDQIIQEKCAGKQNEN